MSHAVQQADDQGGEEGALDRAYAADHDDDEGQDQDAVAHARLDGEDGAGHCAGEPGQHGAEAEDEGEQAADVEAIVIEQAPH